MATDRLYIVDTKTKEYLCLAKNFSEGWDCGNIDLYKSFLASRNPSFNCDIELIIGNENDEIFYSKWIESGNNYNKDNKWQQVK